MSQVQTITCKCGSTFAVSLVPHCYINAEWQRNMRKYVKQGATVAIVDSNDWKLEQCKCHEKTSEPSLFDMEQ